MRLVDSKGRRNNFCLGAGKRFFSNKGHLDHDDLIGREEGFTVTSSGGSEFLVFRPLLTEFVISMPRGAAVIYPKDAAQILAPADVFPGAHVVEAGVGSGALTCSLLRAVGPAGRVTSYERREEFAEVARSNVTQFFGTDDTGQGHPAWTLRLGDLAEELPASGDRSGPDHPRHAGAVGVPGRDRRRAAARGHRARTSRPPPSCPSSSRRSGCTAASPSRRVGVPGARLARRGPRRTARSQMIGHTAFLVTARRMAPGEQAPLKKRRPAPAPTARTTPARGLRAYRATRPRTDRSQRPRRRSRTESAAGYMVIS